MSGNGFNQYKSDHKLFYKQIINNNPNIDSKIPGRYISKELWPT